MRRRLLLLAALLSMPLISFPQYKPWYNFYNFAYGAKARAMGNAFTAVADDLTAAFWNPAGLAGLRDPIFYLGYKTSHQNHDYDLQRDPLDRDPRLYSFRFTSHLNQIDYFSVSAPVAIWRRPCTFALGFYRYIPYGFKGAAEAVLTDTGLDVTSEVLSQTFTGSEGFDVLAFSFAAGLSDYFAVGVTLQEFFNSGALYVQTDDQGSDLHNDVTEKLRGRNLIVGALFTPFSWLRLGAAWHAGLDGDLEANRFAWEIDSSGNRSEPIESSSQARVTIPESYAVGLLLTPVGWLDLSADYSLIEWDKGFIEGYFGAGRLPYPQMDAWIKAQKQMRNLRFGLAARLPLRRVQVELRAGYARDNQLYADQLDRPVLIKGYSLGVGCRFSKNLQVDAALQFQRGDWLENGYFIDDVLTHFRGDAFFLGLTYRFGHIFKN